MEAAMRPTWTDDRLDDFRNHIDERFDAVDRRLGRMERQLDNQTGRIDAQNSRIDSLQQSLSVGYIAIMGGIIASTLTTAIIVITQT
jgi:hypothetical protein